MNEDDAMAPWVTSNCLPAPFSFPTSSSRFLCSPAQEVLSALAGSAEIDPPRACPCSPRFAGEARARVVKSVSTQAACCSPGSQGQARNSMRGFDSARTQWISPYYIGQDAGLDPLAGDITSTVLLCSKRHHVGSFGYL